MYRGAPKPSLKYTGFWTGQNLQDVLILRRHRHRIVVAAARRGLLRGRSDRVGPSLLDRAEVLEVLLRDLRGLRLEILLELEILMIWSWIAFACASFSRRCAWRSSRWASSNRSCWCR